MSTAIASWIWWPAFSVAALNCAHPCTSPSSARSSEDPRRFVHDRGASKRLALHRQHAPSGAGQSSAFSGGSEAVEEGLARAGRACRRPEVLSFLGRFHGKTSGAPGADGPATSSTAWASRPAHLRRMPLRALSVQSSILRAVSCASSSRATNSRKRPPASLLQSWSSRCKALPATSCHLQISCAPCKTSRARTKRC